MKRNVRISYKGKTKIIESDDKSEVVKPKTKPLKDLFNYLDDRNYSNHPNIVEENKSHIKYEYIDCVKTMNEDYHEDFAKAVSNLHLKTTYYKDVSTKKYKDIYNKLIDNVDFLKEQYNRKINNIDNELYMSPSNYLFARGFSLFNSNLTFMEKELNKWYKLVKDKTRERVVVVHNNLKRDNFLKGEKTVLTGWDNFVQDTPVLDLYKLYKNEYKNIDFERFFKKYKEEYELTKEEIILFNILISMPQKINEELNEYEKTKEIKEVLNYISKTNKFIKSGVFD